MPDLWMDVDAALAEVPINKAQLIDDTDFKAREESVVYNQSGLDLVWNFVTTAGAYTQTPVTPTDTGGAHDFVAQGNGFYTIEIPASSGTINNDTEGFGFFAGFATGILPWIGPTIGFRAAGLNNLLIDSAYSATRGLSGTALPDAAADAATGLPVSDAGGLDLDAILVDTAVIGALGVGLTAIPWNADWDAEVQSEVADALTVYDPPTRAELTSDVGSLATLITAVDDFVDTEIAAIKTVVDAVETDTQDIQGRLPAALTGAGNIKADMLAISGDTGAADKLEEGATALVLGVCEGTPTLTNIPTDLTETTVDHYKGRIVTFNGGAVAEQSSDITGYAADGALTVTALTNAPSAADPFVIS